MQLLPSFIGAKRLLEAARRRIGAEACGRPPRHPLRLAALALALILPCVGTARAEGDARMPAEMRERLDQLLAGQYKSCWRRPLLNGEESYVAAIAVLLNRDGSLAANPVLVNPKSDPARLSLGQSALRAVRRCAPLKVPAEFAPYYAQWRRSTLRFDPSEKAL